jgi:hypothetical protein
MDAVIKVKLSELNSAFLERLKHLFQGNEEAELTISFDDRKQKYYESLSRSLEELEQGKDLVTFSSIEELESYTSSKRA